MRRILVMFAAFMALAALPALARDPAPGAYLEPLSGGRVDWEAGVVYATGLGAPPRNARSAAEARAMAARAATVVARRNLLEVIKGVQVDSTTTVENFMVVSDTVVNQVSGFLQQSVVTDTAYLTDGSAQVTVAVPLRGALSDTLIPPAKPFAPRAAVQPAAPLQPEPAPIQAAPVAIAPAPAKPAAPAPPTGLVIDAKGLDARPAMTPRILDQSGKEVFGSAMVSRQFAIQQGMAGYAKDPAAAAANPRVAGNPLTVKAVSVAGPAGADLVIADADAAKVREAEAKARFLEKCRVMIVLD